MNQTRKRLRSEDENFALQTKYFVNQKLVNESNGKLMSEVYGKTLEKLFSGTKMHYKSIHENHKADLKNTSYTVDVIDDQSQTFVGCQSCIRDAMPSATFQCNKCHLRTCSACCLVCQICKSTSLCEFCVSSGNRIEAAPVCEDCQVYIQ